jgi:hypothetical protein
MICALAVCALSQHIVDAGLDLVAQLEIFESTQKTLFFALLGNKPGIDLIASTKVTCI